MPYKHGRSVYLLSMGGVFLERAEVYLSTT
jgi:hypothetical protein